MNFLQPRQVVLDDRDAEQLRDLEEEIEGLNLEEQLEGQTDDTGDTASPDGAVGAGGSTAWMQGGETARGGAGNGPQVR